MQTLDTSGYPPREASRRVLPKGMADSRLRVFLEQLLSSSEDLNIRVWLDGVYTDIDTAEVQDDWMKGREVYFKVEGRVDRLKNGARP